MKVWFKIALFISIYYVRSTETSSCEESRDSITRVQVCPRSKEEWELRAQLKQCSLIRQQCVDEKDFVYHCVINSYANETIEVCAPTTLILGKSCVEYNSRGAIIQESLYLKCNKSCPFSYISSDAYKYPECFETFTKKITSDKVNTLTTNGIRPNISSYIPGNLDNCSGENWMISTLVLLNGNVFLIFGIIYTEWKKRRKGHHHVDTKKLHLHCKASNGANHNLEPLLPSCYCTSEPEDFNSVSWRYVAAIDLGDTYLSMALSDAEAPEDVKQLGSSERMCFLIDHESNTTYFGEEALQKFTMDTYVKEKSVDLNLIKLNDEKVKDDTYTEALTFIMRRARDELFRTVPTVKESEIYHVFVVPYNWDVKAINRLKKGLLKFDNLPKDKFCVIKRELTISPFVYGVKATVLCLNFNVENIELQSKLDKTTYAILHVGSSHYDLIFVKVERNGMQNERNSPERESLPWEKHTLPHECVLNFFERIYGTKSIERWKNSKEFYSFLLRWERLLGDIEQNKSQNDEFTLELSEELVKEDEIEALQNEKGIEPLRTKDIRKRIEEKIEENKEIRLGENDWTFRVKLQWIKTLFKSMELQVKTMVNKTWEDFKSKEVKCVVMTGAYSKSKIIWDIAENVWFQNRKVTIIVPKDRHVFAMGGAYYGQTKWPREKTY